MTWFDYSIIATLSFTLYYLLLKKLIANHQAHAVAFAVYLKIFGALLTLPLVFLEPIQLPHQPLVWVVLAISILVWTWGNVFDIQSFKLAEVSHLTIIKSLSPIITLFLGSLFFQEAISGLKLAGIFFILLGIALIYLHENFSQLDQGKKLQIFATILFSFGISFDKYLLQFFSVFLYIFFNFFILCVSLLIMQKRARRSLLTMWKNSKNIVLIIPGIFMTTGAVTLMQAYKAGGEVSRIVPITSVSNILIVLGGIGLLREQKQAWKKILAAILGVVGIALLSQ